MEREPVYTITTLCCGNDNVFLHNGLKEHPSNDAYSTHENAMESAYNMALEEAKSHGIPATFINRQPNAYRIDLSEEEFITFAVRELTWKD